MGLSTFENHHRLSVWDGEEELVSHSETIFLLIAGLSNESFCDEDNVLCLCSPIRLPLATRGCGALEMWLM